MSYYRLYKNNIETPNLLPGRCLQKLNECRYKGYDCVISTGCTGKIRVVTRYTWVFFNQIPWSVCGLRSAARGHNIRPPKSRTQTTNSVHNIIIHAHTPKDAYTHIYIYIYYNTYGYLSNKIVVRS